MQKARQAGFDSLGCPKTTSFVHLAREGRLERGLARLLMAFYLTLISTALNFFDMDWCKNDQLHQVLFKFFWINR